MLKREVASGRINWRTDGKRGVGGMFVVLSHALSGVLSGAFCWYHSGASIQIFRPTP